jgi:hypothetical protein
MKRVLLLTSLLLALAACSGHTVHRLEVDLLSFVPPGNRTGTLGTAPMEIEIRVPDDPAGQEVPVPGAEALVDGRISLRVGLTNTGTSLARVDLEVRMGPKDDTNLYDGNGDIQVKEESLTLNPGESGSLDLSLDLQPGDPAYDLVKAGSFRIGARLSLSGDRVQYTLEQAEVVLRLKLFNLIP